MPVDIASSPYRRRGRGALHRRQPDQPASSASLFLRQRRLSGTCATARSTRSTATSDTASCSPKLGVMPDFASAVAAPRPRADPLLVERDAQPPRPRITRQSCGRTGPEGLAELSNVISIDSTSGRRPIRSEKNATAATVAPGRGSRCEHLSDGKSIAFHARASGGGRRSSPTPRGY
jgi:hypothetical protein